MSCDYNLPKLKCLRCGHTWNPRTAKRPDVCPKCKQRKWDTAAFQKKKQ